MEIWFEADNIVSAATRLTALIAPLDLYADDVTKLIEVDG